MGEALNDQELPMETSSQPAAQPPATTANDPQAAVAEPSLHNPAYAPHMQVGG